MLWKKSRVWAVTITVTIAVTVMGGHGHNHGWNGPEQSGTVRNQLERSEKVGNGHVTFSAKNERFTEIIF